MLSRSIFVGLLLSSSIYLLHYRKLALRRISKKKGSLHLVGTGPGDPELLTLAAARTLQDADLVITDVLVPKQILDRFVRSTARIRIANKVKGKAHEAQEELQEWTLQGLEEGLNVVRLKGGDPFLYGRGGEEVVYFASKGYQVEVIPGISSSIAGPLSMGIPVTSRGFADQFLIATLHGKRESTPAVPSPYRVNRTIVFLMSVSRVDILVTQLLNADYPKELQVSVVENATLEYQRHFHSTIENLIVDCEKFALQSPSLIVVGGTAGNTAGLPQTVHWDRGGVLFDSFQN